MEGEGHVPDWLRNTPGTDGKRADIGAISRGGEKVLLPFPRERAALS